jgi:hypothetical protein
MFQAQSQYNGELRVTLYEFVTSEFLTAKQATAVINASGFPEGFASRASLSPSDRARLLLIAREARCSNSTDLD